MLYNRRSSPQCHPRPERCSEMVHERRPMRSCAMSNCACATSWSRCRACRMPQDLCTQMHATPTTKGHATFKTHTSSWPETDPRPLRRTCQARVPQPRRTSFPGSHACARSDYRYIPAKHPLALKRQSPSLTLAVAPTMRMTSAIIPLRFELDIAYTKLLQGVD